MKKELEKYDLTPLETFPVGNITLSVILDTRREKSKVYYPIKYRVTYEGKQYYYLALIFCQKTLRHCMVLLRERILWIKKNLSWQDLTILRILLRKCSKRIISQLNC